MSKPQNGGQKYGDFVLKSEAEHYTWGDLLNLMRFLRSPDGCPWDRKQTIESLQPYLLEEAHEAVLAALGSTPQAHCEELGDVLLQLVFQSCIAAEKGHFDAYDMVDRLCRKLVFRHSHLFGEDQAENAQEVEKIWQARKQLEKNTDQTGGAPADILESLLKEPSAYEQAQAFPELAGDTARQRGRGEAEVTGFNFCIRDAVKIQKIAAREGFDWPDAGGALDKCIEECHEMREAIEEKQGSNRVAEEAGDLLFAALNALRLAGVSAETALTGANLKFARRFTALRQAAKCHDRKMEEMSLDELESLWQEIKQDI